MHYQLFKNAMTGRRVQNRVVHLSKHAALVAREKQNKEDELEELILMDGKRRATQRSVDGVEKDLHESGSASVLENMMASVLVSPGGGVRMSSNDDARPKSSPGRKRFGSGSSSNARPGTAPSRGLRPVSKRSGGNAAKNAHGMHSSGVF